jgi:hypothetical protein
LLGETYSAKSRNETLKDKIAKLESKLSEQIAANGSLRVFNNSLNLFEKYLKNGGTDKDFDEWVAHLMREYEEKIVALESELEANAEFVNREVTNATEILLKTNNEIEKLNTEAGVIIINAESEAESIIEEAKKMVEDAKVEIKRMPKTEYDLIADEAKSIMEFAYEKGSDGRNTYTDFGRKMEPAMKLFITTLRNKSKLN